MMKLFLKPAAAYFLVLLILLIADASIVSYLYILLLVLPMLDNQWRLPAFRPRKKLDIYLLAICATLSTGLLILHPEQRGYFFIMLAMTALPEEWFFRAYLLQVSGCNWRGNIIISLGFAALHGISQGPLMAALILLPSLVFGWVYLQTRNLITVVALHATANLLFILYVKKWLIDYI